MEYTVTGVNEPLPQLKFVPQNYVKIPDNYTDGQEFAASPVKALTLSHNYILKYPLNPVYVTEDTNELVYNSRLMEKGREYRVAWGDEHFMLIKGDDGRVSVYVFEADSN